MKQKYADINLLSDNHRRDGLKEKGCSYCNKEFETNKYYSVDVPRTIFRGDDDCFAFHKECMDNGILKLKEEYKDVIF